VSDHVIEQTRLNESKRLDQPSINKSFSPIIKNCQILQRTLLMLSIKNNKYIFKKKTEEKT
jgi:hypothetical protein